MAHVNSPYTTRVDLAPERRPWHRRAASDGDVYRRSTLERDGVGAGAQEPPGGSTAGVDNPSVPISDLVVGGTVPTPQLEAEATAGRDTISTPPLQDASELEEHELTHHVNIGSAPLLRIIEDLDKILRERASLRSTLQMLQNRRSFMETSLDKLQEALETLSPLGVSSEHLAFGATHGAQPSQQPEPKPAQDSSDLVVDGHLDKVSPVVPQTEKQPQSADQPAQNFSRRREIFTSDLKAFRQEEDKFVAVLDALSNREYQLNAKQKALFEDLKDPEKAKMVIERIITDEPLELHKQESTKAASEIPTLVDRYFDRRGDVGVWLERLDELEEAWAEELAEREFIADRGDPLEVPTEVLFSNYENQKASMEKELRQAEEDAKNLERRCQEAGYNIDEYRMTRRSETASEPSETLMSHYPLVAGPLSTINMHPHPSSQRPETQIHSWLSEVPITESAPPEQASIPSSPHQVPLSHGAAPEWSTVSSSPGEAEGPLLVAIQDADPAISMVERPGWDNQAPGSLAATGAPPARHLTPSPTHLSPGAEDHSPGPSLSTYTVAETALTAATTPPGSPEDVPIQPDHPHPEGEGAQHCAPGDPD